MHHITSGTYNINSTLHVGLSRWTELANRSLAVGTMVAPFMFLLVTQKVSNNIHIAAPYVYSPTVHGWVSPMVRTLLTDAICGRM